MSVVTQNKVGNAMNDALGNVNFSGMLSFQYDQFQTFLAK